MVIETSMIVWAVSAVLALGITWSRYEKKKSRDRFVRELAAMDPERREKVLNRLRPELQTELREQLMQRYRLANFR